MPWWLSGILSTFAKPVVSWALNFLESKYPGLKDVIDQITKWLEGQQTAGNVGAMQVLSDHVGRLCSSAGCPPVLKTDD